MDEALTELGEYVASTGPGLVGPPGIAHGELTLEADHDGLLPLLVFLRDDRDCRFRQLVDLCAVDWPDRHPRFDIVYHLLSHARNQRVRVKLRTGDDTPAPSACAVFSAAGWYEREAWDLYGLFFADHPDLRRLLTDYGFDGHPLRKDFPLTGHVEARYDEGEKRVVYEPVSLTQDYRDFDFLSPWEGGDAAPDGKGGGAER